jgi:cytochrome c
MKTYSRLAALAALMTLSVAMFGSDGARTASAQAANPCAPKAANPCAPKAATAGKPAIAPKLLSRPNGTRPFQGDHAQLVKQGEKLFKSTKLSTNEMSCQSCHQGNANFAEGFRTAYPHPVAMVQEKSGLASVDLEQAIQFCMVAPMQAKPLPWNSRELAALSAYNLELQKSFAQQAPAAAPKAANPCAATAANPCAPKK